MNEQTQEEKLSEEENKETRKLKRKLLGRHITENKKVFAIYAILRIMVVGVMIAQFFNGN